MFCGRSPLAAVLSICFVVSGLVHLTLAARYNDFKKCGDSSFCRRLRRLSTYTESHAGFVSPYSIPNAPNIDQHKATLNAVVKSILHPDIGFQLEVRFHKDGTARVRMDQADQRYGGWKRYDEAESLAVEKQPEIGASEGFSYSTSSDETVVNFGAKGVSSFTLTHHPIRATFSRDGVPQVVLNERGLLHMEHFRPKPDPFPTPKGDDEAEGTPSLVFQNKKRSLEGAGLLSSQADAWAGFEEEDGGEWEESFSGRQDTKPKGPEAFSLDIEFPGKSHIFGLPEHASPLNLRSTRGQQEHDFKEPYRLMNTDVFEYDYDSPMSLYGSVPVIHAQSAGSAASILWLAASETWIDIDRTPGISGNETTRTHFFSESGILDLFVFLEPTPDKNMALFTELVGRTPLPQYFALGYHQCRWNYLTTDDVLTVNNRFSDEDIPVDVLWLDIEYAKNHWYGVWNEETFAHPERMLEGLGAEGRKLVIIIDPHFARNDDYYLYKEAHQKDLYVKLPDGKADYEGWCWSGSASWLDSLNPAVLPWWSTQFSLASKKLKANARNMHFWLDMNEPAIFNGPEVTAPKDVKHFGGWEHRDIHNLFSVSYHRVSDLAIRARESPNRRSFALARGWWIGTWKHGAVWTGDNQGTWEHLAVSVPMILANNIGGMSFCGADIGGFFGNPSPDMLVRWYQAGIFEPFFRAHAHIDTKRREPYLLEEPLRSEVRDLIKLRYKMLPVWYTAFKESTATGLPVLRPQYLMFPHDANGLAIDDQYYVGDSGLLVKPAVHKDINTVDIYLSEDKPYYNYFSHDVYVGSASGKRVNVPAPLTSQVPLLQRGGSILAIRERVRRSAELGWRDPVSLIIALDRSSSKAGKIRATGKIYLDDGQTYGYENGDFVWRRFEILEEEGNVHRIVSKDEVQAHSRTSNGQAVTQNPGRDLFVDSIKDVRVERITVLGLEKSPKSVHVEGAEEAATFTWNAGVSAGGSKLGGFVGAKASQLIIKDPKIPIVQDWTIIIT